MGFGTKAKLSRLEVLLNGKTKKSLEYLASIKNSYNGERCFVLGNDPSLRTSDLDKLTNEVTFASNLQDFSENIMETNIFWNDR